MEALPTRRRLRIYPAGMMKALFSGIGYGHSPGLTGREEGYKSVKGSDPSPSLTLV